MERGWDTGGVHKSAKSRMTRTAEERLKRGQRENLLCEAGKRRKDIKETERRGLLKFTSTLGYSSIWIGFRDTNINCVHTPGE